MADNERERKLTDIRGRRAGPIATDGNTRQAQLEAEAKRIQDKLTAGLSLTDEPPTAAALAEAEKPASLVTPAGLEWPGAQAQEEAGPTPEDLEVKALELQKKAAEARRKQQLAQIEAAKNRPADGIKPNATNGKVLHTPLFTDVLFSAYVYYLGKGVEPQTAIGLVQAYSLLEVGDALRNAIRPQNGTGRA